jgi:hypothetical protein
MTGIRQKEKFHLEKHNSKDGMPILIHAHFSKRSFEKFPYSHLPGNSGQTG